MNVSFLFSSTDAWFVNGIFWKISTLIIFTIVDSLQARVLLRLRQELSQSVLSMLGQRAQGGKVQRGHRAHVSHRNVQANLPQPERSWGPCQTSTSQGGHALQGLDGNGIILFCISSFITPDTFCFHFSIPHPHPFQRIVSIPLIFNLQCLLHLTMDTTDNIKNPTNYHLHVVMRNPVWCSPNWNLHSIAGLSLGPAKFWPS